MPSPLRTAPTAATAATAATATTTATTPTPLVSPQADQPPPGTLQLLQRWTPTPVHASPARRATSAGPAPVWAHWLRRQLALR